MRKTIGLALIAMTALVALLALVWQAAPETERHAAPAVAPRQSSPDAPSTPSPPESASKASAPEPGDPAAVRSPSAYPVNLEELRRRLPDNLYWTLGAPTDDEGVLRQRAERARQTNELYGKVLSTTATEEENARYYAERRRVSEDYIQFGAGPGPPSCPATRRSDRALRAQHQAPPRTPGRHSSRHERRPGPTTREEPPLTVPTPIRSA